MSDAPRRAAFAVLRAVRDDDAYVNLLLPRLLREQRLSGRDAAFATELTHGTIRWQGTYDAIIDHLTGREIDPPVRDALRLGAHQLLAMRVPDHAAVSTTVALVRREIGHRPAGFVNAICRRMAERDLDGWLDVVTAGVSGDAELAIRHSHPAWIVAELRRALRLVDSAAELPELLAADNAPPKVTLVARPGLCDPADLPGAPGRLSPWAAVMDAGGDPGAIAEVRDGLAAVQDEGSQLVVKALVDAALEGGPDARWLDLCAGPGGKAGLLAAVAAQRGAHLVANEIQEHRAELVRQSLRALPEAEVVSFDGREGPWESASFDRVLVDAPCTGLGALRRRPEARWRRRPEDLDALVPVQRALLRRAVDLVRPGGIVAYATCSPSPAETVEVVEAVGPGVATLERISRWWPHRDDTDAMFVALLRRR
ncbi:MAG: transcription antitermination factor NusB [Aeromicrobium sp.]|uniref:RsmB/NOP family class I SAM-dependent RNA methyltransferase n=1 Tax=Aeromicrobium sp. TaxID=1871063 RepID=UPI0039E39210